jgi:lysophospholipase
VGKDKQLTLRHLPYVNDAGTALVNGVYSFKLSAFPATPSQLTLHVMDGPHHGSDEARILVIYTGGTIGMMLGPSGYRPEPYFLTESLRSQARFHDPNGDSLFSHAGSSQGFRDWNSGNSPTSGSPRPPDAQLATSNTLVVRSSRPIGTPISGQNPEAATNKTPGSPPQPTCREVESNIYEAELPSLVTPKSSVHGAAGKRIRYAILEVKPYIGLFLFMTN